MLKRSILAAVVLCLPAELIANETNARARAKLKLDEAIPKLEVVIHTSKGHHRAEGLFRLAELYAARSRLLSLIAMQQWDEALEVWSRTRRGPEPKVELRASNTDGRRARVHYNEVLREHPTYGRTDEVLYALASSLAQSEKHREAMATYWKLVKMHPGSELIADAYLQIGEHFFEKNDITRAITAFNKAAETKKPAVYAHALYKLAWCDYNLGEWHSALDKMHRVVAYAQTHQLDRVQLAEEALDDMVRIYSHLDALDEAFDYYRIAVGREETYRYLHTLANLYNEEGKYPLAIRVYQRLNSEHPFHAKTMTNHLAILDAFAQLDQEDQVRAQTTTLLKAMPIWAAKVDKDTAVTTRQSIKQQLHVLAEHFHRQAQKSTLPRDYALARDLYLALLSSFEDDIRLRFYLAETMFELDQFAVAAEQYALVVDADPKGELAEPAAFASMLALDKSATPVDNDALLRACDRLVEVAPDNEGSPKCMYKTGRQLLGQSFTRASRRLSEVIKRWPQHALALRAADDILEYANAQKNWAELSRWATLFQKNSTLMANASFAKKVRAFAEGAAFNEIHEDLEKSLPPDEVAERYVAFARKFPNSKFALVARYNATLAYNRANILEKAIQQARWLVQKTRHGAGRNDAKIRPKALFLLALFHERLAQFPQAAALYEQYANEMAKAARRADALFNAGVLREGLGQHDKAIRALRAYVREKPDDADEVTWRIGLILERKGDHRATASHFASLAKQVDARGLCAQYRSVRALEQLGKDTRAHWSALVKRYETVPSEQRVACSREAASAASFALIERDFADYLAVATDELGAKQKRLRIVALENAYAGVVAIGAGDFGMAALFRIGLAHEHIADVFDALPCPPHLSEQQCDIYQANKHGTFVIPHQNKAIAAFDATLVKGYELGLYNAWLSRAQDALSRYEPGRFPATQEFELIASEILFEPPTLLQ